jgi:plasmid stabilization system protein ParE
VPAVVKKLPPAEADILAAAEWYDDQQPGLGEDLVREVNSVIRSLADSALTHRIRFADVRRAGLKRFKEYGIFYFVHGGAVIVFSVFHGKRHPRWLRERRRKLG